MTLYVRANDEGRIEYVSTRKKSNTVKVTAPADIMSFPSNYLLVGNTVVYSPIEEIIED